MFDVIEHLSKPEILALLEAISNALRPGGVFIAHCPNGNSPFALTVFAGDFTHETLLNEASARHLCKISGLENFAAAEHLGASASMAGLIRAGAWHLVRAGIRTINRLETGSPGSNVLTRNFAFKAAKPAASGRIVRN
jgi:SAM-dependent methyltransferase